MMAALVAGLDTCLSIMRVLHGGTGDPKYRPCPLLVQYVDAGECFSAHLEAVTVLHAWLTSFTTGRADLLQRFCLSLTGA